MMNILSVLIENDGSIHHKNTYTVYGFLFKINKGHFYICDEFKKSFDGYFLDKERDLKKYLKNICEEKNIQSMMVEDHRYNKTQIYRIDNINESNFFRF